MSRKKRKSSLRRKRNAEKTAALMAVKSDRVRRSFFGKGRKGDQAEVRFEFSNIQVPIDPENPTEGLRERTEVQKALWATLSTDSFRIGIRYGLRAGLE